MTVSNQVRWNNWGNGNVTSRIQYPQHTRPCTLQQISKHDDLLHISPSPPHTYLGSPISVPGKREGLLFKILFLITVMNSCVIRRSRSWVVWLNRSTWLENVQILPGNLIHLLGKDISVRVLQVAPWWIMIGSVVRLFWLLFIFNRIKKDENRGKEMSH